MAHPVQGPPPISELAGNTPDGHHSRWFATQWPRHSRHVTCGGGPIKLLLLLPAPSPMEVAAELPLVGAGGAATGGFFFGASNCPLARPIGSGRREAPPLLLPIGGGGVSRGSATGSCTSVPTSLGATWAKQDV